MRRRNTEINIFSMSALDLFASALGAFILITITLFPYFPNIGSSPENVARLKTQLQASQQQLQNCQAELAQTQEALQESQNTLQSTQEELQQCSRELSKRFLLILISWGSEDDIDLHVIDPQGNEFDFAQKSHQGINAKLEEDNTRGPGNEIWLYPQAPQGEYKVYYKLFNHRSEGTVRVRGAMLTPNGRESIPDKDLGAGAEGQKILIATVTVNSEGYATLQPQ